MTLGGRPVKPPLRGAARGGTGVLLMTLLLLATGCGGSSGAGEGDAYGERDAVAIAGETVVVELENIQFQPQAIRIRPGTTVTWVNRDTVIHNVRQVESVFLSPDVMERGSNFSFTFEEPGTYRYQCTFHHPTMNGVVIVE
jgi:plastocyanin